MDVFYPTLVAFVVLGLLVSPFVLTWLRKRYLGERYRRTMAIAIVIASTLTALMVTSTVVFAIAGQASCGRPKSEQPASPPTVTAPNPDAVPPLTTSPSNSVGASSPAKPPNTATMNVFFGTDRQPLESTRAIFANAPTDGPGELTLGRCVVNIPIQAHRIGRIERPTFYTLHVSDWFEDPKRHFVILERPVMRPDEFWNALADEVVDRGERQVLLFIHGYNVSFDDAIYRTAQVAFDLQFGGVPVLYSWPSNAETLRYVADRDHSLSTLQAFERFLVDLAHRSGARTIQVIAHSMGNNTLVHALSELARDRAIATPPRFREIIMAAPDVDRREFLRLSDAFQSSADHITLYAADNDRAIGASDRLSGAPRVGDANPMFLQHGIDSIDASSVIKGFLKHSYFAESRILLDDMQRILQSHASPPRFGLAGMPRNDKAEYWRFLQ